jgi:hypothetical protein
LICTRGAVSAARDDFRARAAPLRRGPAAWPFRAGIARLPALVPRAAQNASVIIQISVNSTLSGFID